MKKHKITIIIVLGILIILGFILFNSRTSTPAVKKLSNTQKTNELYAKYTPEVILKAIKNPAYKGKFIPAGKTQITFVSNAFLLKNGMLLIWGIIDQSKNKKKKFSDPPTNGLKVEYFDTKTFKSLGVFDSPLITSKYLSTDDETFLEEISDGILLYNNNPSKICRINKDGIKIITDINRYYSPISKDKVLILDYILEIYDFKTKKTTPAGDYDERWGAVKVNKNKIAFTKNVSDLHVYVNQFKQWQSMQINKKELINMSSGSECEYILDNGNILLVGGYEYYSNDKALTRLDMYDVKENKVKHIDDMVVPREDPVITTLKDGRILITGGEKNRDHQFNKESEIFDPKTNKIIQVGNMQEARQEIKPVLLNDGKVLFTGGINELYKPYLTSAEVFDPITNKFHKTGDMIHGRINYFPVKLHNGTVLIIGGDSNDDDIDNNKNVSINPYLSTMPALPRKLPQSFQNLQLYIPE